MIKNKLIKYNFYLRIGILVVCMSFIACDQSNQAEDISSNFPLLEITVAEIHNAFRNGELNSHQLVEMYIKRIKTFDQSSKLNSIIVLNPNAIQVADKLDAEFKNTGILRPLHGIPIIVKDNYNTKNLPTTGGSLAMKGSIPQKDAYQIKKLREAGAIILAKSNMAEWAFSAYQTVSSIAGITRNPYDLNRVPAGSSGGTAASIAANFAILGMGTDTGNSIRGPASHNNLVGIRSTMGLTSRDGIIPLMLRNDIGGPLTRTVEDAVRILEVIAGYDEADPITELSKGKIPENYLQFLDKNGLKGARIGVFRQYINVSTADPGIIALTEKAIYDMETLGAIIVDPFEIPDFDILIEDIWCNVFQTDLNKYLESLGKGAPYKSLQEIKDSGLYMPYIEDRIIKALSFNIPPEERDPPCVDIYNSSKNIKFRDRVIEAMDKANIDAIIYPTWSNPPRLIGDLESPSGDNSQYLSPHTGMPAITVPTGFTENGLPAGITFVGKLFEEPTLIRFAYAYEQGTKHRRPPERFPRLINNKLN